MKKVCAADERDSVITANRRVIGRERVASACEQIEVQAVRPVGEVLDLFDPARRLYRVFEDRLPGAGDPTCNRAEDESRSGKARHGDPEAGI